MYSVSQGVELSALSAAVSHFLNCFLSSFDAVAHLPADELVSRRKNRKRRNRVPGGGDNTAWASLTPSELWKNIVSEAQSYYNFTLHWWVGIRIDVGTIVGLTLAHYANKLPLQPALGECAWDKVGVCFPKNMHLSTARMLTR